MTDTEKVARALCEHAIIKAYTRQDRVEELAPFRAVEVDHLWRNHIPEAKAAIAAMPVHAEPVATRWQLGDKVRKKRGSSWRGTVCGFYNTPHTPQGYCVDSAFEPGSVQVWPEAALEDWDGVMVEDERQPAVFVPASAVRAELERIADE